MAIIAAPQLRNTSNGVRGIPCIRSLMCMAAMVRAWQLAFMLPVKIQRSGDAAETGDETREG
jgi:hypothetical protein